MICFGLHEVLFYLAWEYLERMRPNTDFFDVIFLDDKIGDIHDWQLFEELDPILPKAFLNKEVKDIDKPSGPWSPYASELDTPVDVGTSQGM